MAKLVTAVDSKSTVCKDLRVRVPPSVLFMYKKPLVCNKELLAYITGIAIGDGNLSNPNKRATRLRITCDLKYPQLIQKIQKAIQTILPKNKISLVSRKGNCVDLSCYSNHWEQALGWYAGKGSKSDQQISIPSWIKKNRDYKIRCLEGLIETDGTIYTDRGYKMVSFTTVIPGLAKEVYDIIKVIGFSPHIYKIKRKVAQHKQAYRIRLSRNVSTFLKIIQIKKV